LKVASYGKCGDVGWGEGAVWYYGKRDRSRYKSREGNPIEQKKKRKKRKLLKRVDNQSGPGLSMRMKMIVFYASKPGHTGRVDASG
jgi:hypothetical protein